MNIPQNRELQQIACNYSSNNRKANFEKLRHDMNRKAAKISSAKIDKYESLTGEEILPSSQSRIIEQARFTYSTLGKAFEKQTKTIEEQGRKQTEATEEHGKELLKCSSEKESSTHLKQKQSFQELATERINEIQDLSKQIGFDDSVYDFKGDSGTKIFISFKGLLAFYRNIRDGYIAREKAEENKKNQIRCQ